LFLNEVIQNKRSERAKGAGGGRRKIIKVKFNLARYESMLRTGKKITCISKLSPHNK
jgi:hypothetical protein